jgi:hypothetical protein
MNDFNHNHTFQNGQKVKDRYGKVSTVCGDYAGYECSITTTAGNYHPNNLTAA